MRCKLRGQLDSITIRVVCKFGTSSSECDDSLIQQSPWYAKAITIKDNRTPATYSILINRLITHEYISYNGITP